MATKEEHLAKANSNAVFAKSITLSSQINVDWAFTALFYSGLHYVEAYLSKINASPETHNTHARRDKLVATDPKLKTLNRQYRDLKYFSEQARYFCGATNAQDFQDDALPALEKIQVTLTAVL